MAPIHTRLSQSVLPGYGAVLEMATPEPLSRPAGAGATGENPSLCYVENTGYR